MTSKGRLKADGGIRTLERMEDYITYRRLLYSGFLRRVGNLLIDATDLY